jgi:anaerobic magnesium-protoporphyrin IX monomethyl ester cyclase
MKIGIVFPRYKYPTGDIPLGICYLSSYLQKTNNVKPQIIDTTFHESIDETKKILNEKFDLVCFSIMTTMIKDSLELANHIKEKHPNTKIVFGGPHTTVMPGEILKEKVVDAVVIGEGEKTFSDLIKNNLDFKKTLGLWYKEDKIIKNQPNTFIHDLDDIPFPDLEQVDIKNYFKNWFQLESVKFGLHGLNIIASRGCPYDCTFCQPTLSRIFGKKIRKRSAKNIKQELVHWKNKYNIKAFMFQDDTLIADKKWTSEICREITNLNLLWGCNVRANLVEEKTLRKMKAAGLRKVFMGIESGSQRVLNEVYDKKITLKQVEQAVNVVNKLGIKIQGYFMVGAPTETLKEIKQTIKFSNKLNLDEATFSITTPLPHTYLYDMIKDKINKEITDFDYYKNSVFKHELGAKKLDSLRKQALLKFYLNPKRIFKTATSFLTPASFVRNLKKLKRF